MDAVILAGGQGKRLRPYTADMPKCLVPINGIPMLSYQIEWLKKNGVNRIIIACGYKWEKIKERFGDSLIYSVEKEPLGTGGALKLALDKVQSDEFVVVNCDDLSDIELKKFQKMGSNAIALARFNSPFGIVETANGVVRNFSQKPLLPYWANMGVYLLNKSVDLPDRGDLETMVFHKIELKAYKHEGYWITINTDKDLEEAESILKK